MLSLSCTLTLLTKVDDGAISAEADRSCGGSAGGGEMLATEVEMLHVYPLAEVHLSLQRMACRSLVNDDRSGAASGLSVA
jgi:hypothetical protein